MANILLTYGWVRSSYSVLRSLKAEGHNIVVSDDSIFGMSQFSLYKDGFEKYTSHYEDEDKFIEDLLRIVKKRNIDLIFPSHNETEVISRHKDKFEKKLVSLLPQSDHCKIFNNKSLSYDLAESLEIPTPKRITYSDPRQISKNLEQLGIKRTVIKLLTGNSSKGVYYGNSYSHSQSLVLDLIKKNKLSRDRYPQLEEYVEGDGFGNSVLYWQGQKIADFTHKRLRDKIESGGTSTLREKALHSGIEEATRKIFDSIGWHGLAMCEYKICPKTNKFWFIEVNPRLWGSVPLAIKCGVNFPALSVQCQEKGSTYALKKNEELIISDKWKARWLLGDIFVIFSSCLSLNFNRAKQILNTKDVNSIDDFFWDDPFVFFGQILSYIKKSLSKLSFNPAPKGMVK